MDTRERTKHARSGQADPLRALIAAGEHAESALSEAVAGTSGHRQRAAILSRAVRTALDTLRASLEAQISQQYALLDDIEKWAAGEQPIPALCAECVADFDNGDIERWCGPTGVEDFVQPLVWYAAGESSSLDAAEHILGGFEEIVVGTQHRTRIFNAMTSALATRRASHERRA